MIRRAFALTRITPYTASKMLKPRYSHIPPDAATAVYLLTINAAAMVRMLAMGAGCGPQHINDNRRDEQHFPNPGEPAHLGLYLSHSNNPFLLGAVGTAAQAANRRKPPKTKKWKAQHHPLFALSFVFFYLECADNSIRIVFCTRFMPNVTKDKPQYRTKVQIHLLKDIYKTVCKPFVRGFESAGGGRLLPIQYQHRIRPASPSLVNNISPGIITHTF